MSAVTEPSAFGVLEAIETMVPTATSVALLTLVPMRNCVCAVIRIEIDLSPAPRIVKPSDVFAVTAPKGFVMGCVNGADGAVFFHSVQPAYPAAKRTINTNTSMYRLFTPQLYLIAPVHWFAGVDKG